ncbi:MAG: type II secretion system protein M [Betaproteobacteria bacterium]|nr:type II secretion system protein M [Betaproteobacteria bacterium]
MKFAAAFTNQIEPLRSRWRSLSAPAQKALALVSVVALLLIFWAYAWLPAARARDDLRARGSAWETELVVMRGLADEARRLRLIAPIAAKESARTLADRAALQALFGADTKIATTDGRAFQLAVANVPYNQWLERLDQSLAKHRLKLVSVKLRAVAPAADERTAVAVEWVMADEP